MNLRRIFVLVCILDATIFLATCATDVYGVCTGAATACHTWDETTAPNPYPGYCCIGGGGDRYSEIPEGVEPTHEELPWHCGSLYYYDAFFEACVYWVDGGADCGGTLASDPC